MYQNYFKRLFDILISLILIVMTLPLFIGIFLIIQFYQGKPFFLQKRPGLNGKIFTVFKFRTMNDEIGKDGKIYNDEQRVTPIGRFLRKTNLDELPQLYNVFLGSMSLIGPRPFLEEYLSLYNNSQEKRHIVKPGITGWAQINGGNNIPWEKKLMYDIEYVEKVSLRFDLKILFITCLKIVTLKGFDTGTFIPQKFKG